MFALVATLISVVMTVLLEVEIYSNSTEYARQTLHVELQDKDLEYNWLDVS